MADKRGKPKALELRTSVLKQFVGVPVFAAFIVLAVVNHEDGESGWGETGSMIVLFAVFLVLAVYNGARARTQPWLMRLDDDGVTVRGKKTVPWSEIREVQVGAVRPRVALWGPRVVAFVGRDDDTLPSLPVLPGFGWMSRRTAGMRERLYGTKCIVMPSTVNASVRGIVADVRECSDVPVVRRNGDPYPGAA